MRHTRTRIYTIISSDYSRQLFTPPPPLAYTIILFSRSCCGWKHCTQYNIPDGVRSKLSCSFVIFLSRSLCTEFSQNHFNNLTGYRIVLPQHSTTAFGPTELYAFLQDTAQRLVNPILRQWVKSRETHHGREYLAGYICTTCPGKPPDDDQTPPRAIFAGVVYLFYA